MPALFDQGFFVRQPAWHQLGVVLDEYPGREDAMRLAGHDFDVVEIPLDEVEIPVPAEVRAAAIKRSPDAGPPMLKGRVAHLRSDNLRVLHNSKASHSAIPNSVPYDFAELLLDQGFKYETGITLKDGAECALTLYLDEPVVIPGDDSITLPYLGLSWAHDGTAALKGRGTSVRQVCANTVSLSEAEGRRLGTDFTIIHRSNWQLQVEDAKKAYKGVRDEFEVFTTIARELAATPVTVDQRELFVHSVIPLEIARAGKLVSDQVVKNVDAARAAMFNLFDGPTIPEAHKLTAYGLQLAGVEYLDHLRGYRSEATYVGRTLLKHDSAKAKLGRIIQEVVKA